MRHWPHRLLVAFILAVLPYQMLALAQLQDYKIAIPDSSINKCLNFVFHKHLSGPLDHWDATIIDYGAAIPSDKFAPLAALMEMDWCPISPESRGFDPTNGFHWILALHNQGANNPERVSQIRFDDVDVGIISLASYLLGTDAFYEISPKNFLKARLKALAQSDANAAYQLWNLRDKLEIGEEDSLLKLSEDLGSKRAYIRNASETQLRQKLGNNAFLDSLTNEERAMFFYYACARFFFEGKSEETAACDNFQSEPELVLFKIFATFNGPYNKQDIIEAKTTLFELIENPERSPISWTDQFTRYQQSIILLAQLFAHFSFDETIFSEADTQRYLEIALNNALPMERTAFGYYLVGLYTSFLVNGVDDDLNKKHESISEVLSGGEDNLFDFCMSENKLRFSSMDRWPTGPLLPIISTYSLTDVVFLDLESAADDKATVRISGRWKHLDPSFLKLRAIDDRAQYDVFCQFKFLDGGEKLLPNDLQAFTSDQSLQKEFTSKIESDYAAGEVTLSESGLWASPKGEVEWVFEFNQLIKLETDLRQFPFTAKRTAIEFGFAADGRYYSYPHLTDKWGQSIVPGAEIFSADGNRFFTSSNNASRKDIALEVNLFVNLTYYVLRVIAPVLIFVSLGLFTLLKARENTEAQLQVATTVMVALVAYQFVINSTLPKLAYLTLIDMFLLASVASSAFIILFNLVPHLEKNDTRISENLFMLSRVGGVGGYVISAMILIYGLWLYIRA